MEDVMSKSRMIHVPKFEDTKAILVPTDLSDRSRPGLEYAIEMANRLGAKVHLLHVLEPATAFPVIYAGIVSEAEFMGRREEAVSKALTQFAGDYAPRVELAQRIGTPFVEVIRFARERGVDLIVMTTHGRTGVTHMLIGSVAERVVRKAPCPVLVVPTSGGFESP
jgi:nucleotide-binding universal stress UspA family protein